MTKWLFTLFVLLVVPVAGLASVCATTTYDQIMAGGSCTIADKSFGSWFFSSSASGGATQMFASNVAFAPLPTANNPGVRFSSGFGVNGSGQTQDESFAFTVTVPTGKAPITDISLLMAGAGFTGTGSASVAETVCVGDLFSDANCKNGKILQLSTFDNGTEVKLSDSATFSGVMVVDVIKDLELTSGSAGSAVVSVVDNRFSEGTTPEPGTLALVGSGLLAFGASLRMRPL